MRTLVIIFIIALTFTGCKNKNNQDNLSTVLSTQWMNEIQLNEGKKWIANTETNKGVEKMQSILQSQSTETIEDYHQLASQLNEVKNKVIKECTMKGESHDNLHVWLLPLIDKIDALFEVTTIDNAAKLKQSIIDNINAYNNYFE